MSNGWNAKTGRSHGPWGIVARGIAQRWEQARLQQTGLLLVVGVWPSGL